MKPIQVTKAMRQLLMDVAACKPDEQLLLQGPSAAARTLARAGLIVLFRRQSYDPAPDGRGRWRSYAYSAEVTVRGGKLARSFAADRALVDIADAVAATPQQDDISP